MCVKYQNNDTVKTLMRRLGTLFSNVSALVYRAGSKVIKLFSCSSPQSMKFSMLINIKLLTIANSFLLNIAKLEKFSAKNFMLREVEHEKSFIT